MPFEVAVPNPADLLCRDPYPHSLCRTFGFLYWFGKNEVCAGGPERSAHLPVLRGVGVCVKLPRRRTSNGTTAEPRHPLPFCTLGILRPLEGDRGDEESARKVTESV